MAFMMTIKDRAAFFRAQGNSVRYSLTLARAEASAEAKGLVCLWQDEDQQWDGDCEPPAYCYWGAVYRANDVDEWHGTPFNRAIPLSSLGMVGVNETHDPYLRVCAAELFIEALAVLDCEARDEADSLAARATYAT